MPQNKPKRKDYPKGADGALEYANALIKYNARSDTMQYDEKKTVEKGDEKLREANKGEDLPADIKKEQRRRSKISNIFKKKSKKLSRKKKKEVEEDAEKIVKEIRG